MANYDEEEKETPKTLGDKAAELLTRLSGTWGFVGYLFVGIVIWIIVNFILGGNAFDPYPFILLNFIVSLIACLQALLIMIVQKQYDEKDRQRAKHTNSLVRKLDKEIDKLETMIKDLHDDHTKRFDK